MRPASCRYVPVGAPQPRTAFLVHLAPQTVNSERRWACAVTQEARQQEERNGEVKEKTGRRRSPLMTGRR